MTSPDSPKRVVSLIASSTEIVCALGYFGWLVGRSHECDYPPEVLCLPVCSETKFAADGTSYQIDEKVKAILQEGLSVYRVKADLIRELRPDVIITQIQCEVCAVAEKDVERAVREWTGRLPVIVSLQPDSLEGIWDDIRRVASALGDASRGEKLITRLNERIRVSSKRALALSERPRVACIEWIEPLMAAGNWMPTLVELAGGRNLFGQSGRHSPGLKWEALRASDPDVIVVSPCGFDLERTRQESHHFEQLPGWRELRAVKEGRVALTDGNAFFNRPGPRIVESLEILTEIIHPDLQATSWKGKGWQPYGLPSIQLI